MKKLSNKPKLQKQKRKTHVLKQKIYLDSHVDYFEIFIYDNNENLIKGFNRWHRRQHPKSDYTDDFEAMYGEPYSLNMLKRQRLCGALFYNRKNFNHGLIVHEIAHASVYYMREVIGYTGTYSNKDYISNFSEEERLAYLEGELMDKIVEFAYQNKIKITRAKK
jgi:hypothetical protein